MSFDTYFADMLEPITLTVKDKNLVKGRQVNNTTSTIDINAIVQPYSETAINNNSIQIDRNLEGKNQKGRLLLLTSSNLEIGKGSRFHFDYDDNFTYEIDQKMLYNKILEHYEYLASMVKVE